jgi:hypothetical protein
LVNPAEIIDSLVDLLRDIPELVQEMGGDEQRIFAYHDRYPKNVSLEMAKYQMPAPSVMIAWQGVRLGSRGGFNAWKHDLSISLRAKEETSDPPDGYYRLYRLVTKGVPATIGDGQPMIYATVHPSCEPMDDIPPIQRQTDAMGVDYFEISMSFTEIGDD